MATIIQIRRDTAANWTAENPILAEGEEGYELDTGKRKVGDGVNQWNDLDYNISGGTAEKEEIDTSGDAAKTIADDTTLYIINPSAPVATMTRQLPGTPAEGQKVSINILQDITSFTITCDNAHTIVGSITAEEAIAGNNLQYQFFDDVWYLTRADIGDLSLNWSNISGKPANITLMGNTFNGADQLVKLDGDGKLPAIDGSALTDLPTEIVWVADEASRPLTGDATKAYVSKATGFIYRWDGTLGNYQQIGGGNGTPYMVASGTNTYIATNTPSITSYPRAVYVSFANANTSGSTIKIDSLSALPIKLHGNDTVSGDILSGDVKLLILSDDNTHYQLQSHLSISFPPSGEKVVTAKPDGLYTDYDIINEVIDTIDDSGGVKTNAYMLSNYSSAYKGQYVIGKAGIYRLISSNGISWAYFENKIL